MTHFDWRLARRRFLTLCAALALLSAGFPVKPARAETDSVSIGLQFGIAYLPLLVIKNKNLLEAHAERRGLGRVKTTWNQLGNGVAINEALLSGDLDIASGGVTVFLNLWDKTHGEIKGVAALEALPMYLVTRNPNVNTLRDFTEQDRIALVSNKVGTMAVVLQMASEKIWGKGQHNQLTNLTVNMRHPEALTALISGRTEINAYFGAPPYQDQALGVPGIRKILSSYDVMGGPHIFNMIWAKSAFREKNPKLYQAFYAALSEAQTLINNNPQEATRIYIEEEQSKLGVERVMEIITSPDIKFTNAPLNIMKFAAFMGEVGLLKNRPASWEELFLPDVHGEAGN